MAAIALGLLVAGPRPCVASPGDSLAVHFEIGASADASNELYYEQTYTDTTFLGRRLYGTPESREAGVAAMDLAGRRGDGRWEYGLHPELTLGDEVTRASATGSVRFRPDDRWRMALEPRFEFSHDRSFDLDRREVLFASTGGVRRLFGDGLDQASLRVGGEFLSTPGSGDPFLLAHRVGRAALGWDHDGLLGTAWSARYEAALRTFPDSVARDHQEHEIEFSARRDFLGGHGVSLLGVFTRRFPLRDVPGTRDRFAEGRAELRGTLRFNDAYSLVLSVDGDGYRYDHPDSLVDFDYAVARGDLRIRRDFSGRAWLAAGPKWEVLTAPWNRAERYAEVAASLEVEFLDTGRWWLVEPSAGRRGYEASEDGTSTDPSAIHSSYLFVGVQALGDQALPGRLRARITFDGRAEKHDDPSQDSRSLYFSLDVRRLF